MYSPDLAREGTCPRTVRGAASASCANRHIGRAVAQPELRFDFLGRLTRAPCARRWRLGYLNADFAGFNCLLQFGRVKGIVICRVASGPHPKTAQAEPKALVCRIAAAQPV
jgi:hypothetical protein